MTSRDWQISGYIPTLSEEEKMRYGKARLDYHNECAKKITNLLTTWMWNAFLIGGICLIATVFSLAIRFLFGVIVTMF